MHDHHESHLSYETHSTICNNRIGVARIFGGDELIHNLRYMYLTNLKYNDLPNVVHEIYMEHQRPSITEVVKVFTE